MDKPLVIRPRFWLLFGAIGAIILVPVVLRVALPILALLAAWRLLTWTTYRASYEGFEARSVLGVKRFAWLELTSSGLDAPTGMPPAYELRFGKHKVRLVAAHHDRKQALKALIVR